MKLNVVSDLHLSQGGLPAPSVDSDRVVLAGDIARPAQAVEWAKSLRKPVLYVPGTHEFYGGSLPGPLRELKRLTEGSQVHVLDDEEICFGSVRFLGCTLWTNFRLAADAQGRELAVRAALERVHDFRRIHVDDERQVLFTPDYAEKLFERSAAWLQLKLGTAWAGPTVVITHHAPSERSVSPQFRGSPLNDCFASHLDRLLGRRFAAMWIHGHMHHSVDYDADGTRVVCNPRGYAREGRNENADFDMDFIVEVA